MTDSFQLTYGLRMDMPLFFDTPAENAKFNEWAAGKGYGFKTNQKLASTPMWSPRVGFRWDIERTANIYFVEVSVYSLVVFLSSG